VTHITIAEAGIRQELVQREALGPPALLGFLRRSLARSCALFTKKLLDVRGLLVNEEARRLSAALCGKKGLRYCLT